ncbi:MAG: (2Fe-2S)-binding protein [Eggerthellaceae bacterium]|nr:(2Fe-2S)-binding protein [Eggerthellaceae bacterium]
MVNVIIDGRTIEVAEGATLLDAAQSAGIDIPTLCWMKDLNIIGSCRVCLVDVEGEGLVASCETVAREGMVVRTDTPAVAAARRAELQLIMGDHRAVCASCVRQETCALRDLASRYNVADPEELPAKGDWDATFPLQRDASKCIKCMRCVAECEKVQYCKVWDFTGAGPQMRVITKEGLPIAAAGCAACGQCITHCPTGALTARDDIDPIMAKILDPDVVTVIQVAPAVRSSWGEGVGLTREEATPGRMAAAMRRLGFDHVYDTDFAADLTIMEEGTEFIEWYTEGKPRPMFTSCCPGWVRFAKLHYPDFVGQLSSSKSPHQMMGAVVKNLLRKKAENEGKEIFVVSIMPCVAKKYECSVPQLATEAGPDVDAVLTVREFDRYLRLMNIDCKALPEESFDDPLCATTGAATIFGRTGGVMEAALRTAAFLLTGENPPFEVCDTTESTPEKPWVAKELSVAGLDLRIAVASGLGNTAKLLDALRDGTEKFDFVEIMACPGGCVGGGGQPIEFNKELAAERACVLNTLDENDVLRYSHENPDIQRLYADVLDKPLSELAEEWLHTDQEAWDI